MLTENRYSRQGHPPYFSNFVVLTMGQPHGEIEATNVVVEGDWKAPLELQES